MNFSYSNLRFIKNIFLANFLKKLKEPYKITLNVTDKCNSRCVNCNIWKKTNRNELSVFEIKKIFKNLNTDWINITGGEPFLRKDLFEVLKIIKKETTPALINITTNGLTPQTIIEEVRKIASLKFSGLIITVSLDGPPNINNKIRGLNYSWAKALKTFSLLKAYEKYANIKVYLGYTISEYNSGYLKKTFESVKNEIHGIKASDFHINLFHKSYYYGNLNSKQVLDKKKVLKDIEWAYKIKKNILGPISMVEKRFIKILYNFFDTKDIPFLCSALHSSCYIDSAGIVYPCIQYNEKIGELRKNNFDLLKIWNSKNAELLKDGIEKYDCPKCWTACEANPSILNNVIKNKWKYQ